MADEVSRLGNADVTLFLDSDGFSHVQADLSLALQSRHSIGNDAAVLQSLYPAPRLVAYQTGNATFVPNNKSWGTTK